MNRNDNADATRDAAGRYPPGASTGGMASTADPGIADAMQRAAEVTDEATPDAASVGELGHDSKDVAELPVEGGARPTPMKASTESIGTTRASPTARAFDDEDEEEPWPKALPDSDEPRNESAIGSLGRSISQVITGGTHENEVESDSKKKKR